MVVDTLEGVIEAVAEVRSRGHHRVVVKEAFGLAGHNAIRLWEPEILRTQRQWLAQALEEGSRLVVEPWLEREVDFSAQLEMEPCGLKLCGYTGLINDHRGQFLANWAEADSSHSLPGTITDFFGPRAEMSEQIESIWNHIFSLLEAELQKVGFLGPVSIDAFVYRTTRGEGRLKPVVEINPRYTMGRLTLELMKHACPGSCGLFRVVSLAEAAKEGFSDFPGYARSLTERLPLSLERDSRIRKGAICLNDPETAQAWLATFEVSRTLENLGEARLHTIPRRLPMPRPNTGSR